MSLDDNAEYRHPEWDEFRRPPQVRDDREQLAHEKGLQYIGLEGTVGIIANGAGLAMSTLDVVNQVGGKAANFLDIGGGANADVMAAALEVINFDADREGDPHQHLRRHHPGRRGGQGHRRGPRAGSRLQAPMVIRLDGTNAEEGRRILADAGIPDDVLSSVPGPTMLDAARTAAVALAMDA